MDITSERIKYRRKSLNMSQDELAKLCGYKDRSSITKIETSAKKVPLDKLKIFASALKTTPEYLMGWEDINGNTAPDEITTEAVYDYLVKNGFVEPGEDLTDADLKFLEAQLESIALWFRNKNDSRK